MNRVLLLFIFLPYLAWAQPDVPAAFIVPNEREGIAATGYFMGASSHIPGEFIKAFYRGEYLDGSLINRAADNLGAENRFGGGSSYGMAAVFRLDSAGKQRVHLALRDRSQFSGSLPGNLFRIIFQGNKSFAGKTANLSPARFGFLRFQHLQAGISGLDNKVSFSVGLIKGEKAQGIVLEDAWLYTHPDGKTLDFGFNYDEEKTDTSGRQGPLAWKGTGVTIDMHIKVPVGEHPDHYFTAGIQDAGMIWWNKRTLAIRADTIMHWEGIAAGNIFELRDSVVTTINEDSIAANLSGSGLTNSRTVLPGWFRAAYHVPLGKKFSVLTGVDLLLDRIYRAHVLARGYYQFSPGCKVWIEAGYGGYGSFHAGPGIEATWNKWFVIASAPGLTGLFLNQQPLSLSGVLRTGKYF